MERNGASEQTWKNDQHFLHQIDQYNASYSYFAHESLQMNKIEGFMKKTFIPGSHFMAEIAITAATC